MCQEHISHLGQAVAFLILQGQLGFVLTVNGRTDSKSTIAPLWISLREQGGGGRTDNGWSVLSGQDHVCLTGLSPHGLLRLNKVHTLNADAMGAR